TPPPRRTCSGPAGGGGSGLCSSETGVRERAVLPLVGTHNISNALGAVAVGFERGITLAEAVASLSTIRAADKRGQVVQLGNIRVINDCYNSNPKALEAM